MKTVVDLAQIDSRYFEKPYYLLTNDDEADEGYIVLARNRIALIAQRLGFLYAALFVVRRG